MGKFVIINEMKNFGGELETEELRQQNRENKFKT